MFFVATTRGNISSAQAFEILHRIVRIIRDYTGVLTEDAVRRNFVLIYELLDEVLDLGYPQEMSTEELKSYVFNEPVELETHSSLANAMDKLRIGERKTVSSSAAQRSVISSAEKDRKGGASNELFVDIIEKLHATFDAAGKLQSSFIDGSIIMRSFLSGSPEIHLGLNADLAIGRGPRDAPQPGSVAVDDMNFHRCANLTAFESDRMLAFYPPDGEFTLLNYRCSGEFAMPFRVYPYFEDAGQVRVDLVLRIRAEFPEQCHASNVIVQFPVPESAVSVGFEVGTPQPGQETEYKQNERMAYFRVKKLSGGSELHLRAKVAFSTVPSKLARKQIGPVSMTFEVPMFNVSGLNIRFLRIQERDKSYNPARWVRYITQSNSYVSRL
jgi:AP-4 complex subunit mu-1